VDAVMERLAMSPQSPVAHQVPLGMKESSSLIIDMLRKMEENVGVVGICGKAGIGKTTLAMEVYNHARYSRFDFGYRFLSLSNLKAFKRRTMKDGILQARLDSDFDKEVISEFKHDFEQIFQGEKIFLVIDGVVKKKQFDQLVLLKNLTPGSRVLITSRDNNLLKKILKDASQGEFYEVSTLNKIDSLHLFQRCIFHSKRIDAMDFALPSTSKGDAMNVALHSAGKGATVDIVVQNLTTDIASACQGLPLALEVMGGFLSDKLNAGYEQQLHYKRVK
jgi:cytidylate kinase